jgi:hypothetical protein
MIGKTRRQEVNRHRLRALFALVMFFCTLQSAAFVPLSYAWSGDDREESLFDTKIGEQTEEGDPEENTEDEKPDLEAEKEGEEKEENAATQNCLNYVSALQEPDDFADIETLPDPAESDGEPEMTVQTKAETRVLSPPEEDIAEEETVTETEPALAHAEETGLSETEEDLDREVPLRSFTKSTPEITRNIFRITVSAEDLEYTAAHHAEYAIADQNGNTVTTLTLSDDNLWKADWEIIAGAGSSFSAEELGIYDSAGNDITGNWTTESQTSEESDEYDYSGWSVTDSMGSVGSYVIEYENGGQKYLLAVEKPYDDPKKASPYYYWGLTGEQNSPMNASDAAIWNVELVTTKGIVIRNVALAEKKAYLTGKNLSGENRFAVIRDTSYQHKSFFENNRLKTADNIYLKAVPGGISGAASADEATVLTVYHPVSYHDIIYEKSVSFFHTSLPPPVQYTTVQVKLQVGGNVGERNREFPITASVNDGDAIQFSLKHNGEYKLTDIPVGARLTVSIDPSGHTITSSFTGGEEEEPVLTVLGVPADGGTVVFSAVREAELDTGISSDTGPPCLIFLISLFSYIALKPFIKVKAQKTINTSKGEY